MDKNEKNLLLWEYIVAIVFNKSTMYTLAFAILINVVDQSLQNMTLKTS